jgi:hypothetical protein
MSASKLQRPPDDAYYVEPWSDTFLQGDLFRDVPVAIPAPPDAVVMAEGERRFVSGPFDAGPAMLISPSCAIAAQGPNVSPGSYAHPARTLVPIRPVDELVDAGAIPEHNLGNLRADRLVNYLYLPAVSDIPVSAALLYMPVTVHHDVIAHDRFAQLTGAAFWHLRVKLMAFVGGFLLDPSELGDVPEPTSARAS